MVAPSALWSPPLYCGRPLCTVVAPYALWSPTSMQCGPLVSSWTDVWSPITSMVVYYAFTLPLGVSTFSLGTQLVVESSLWSPTIVLLHGEHL